MKKPKDGETYWTEEEVLEALKDPKLPKGAKRFILISYKEKVSIEQAERVLALLNGNIQSK